MYRITSSDHHVAESLLFHDTNRFAYVGFQNFRVQGFISNLPLLTLSETDANRHFDDAKYVAKSACSLTRLCHKNNDQYLHIS